MDKNFDIQPVLENERVKLVPLKEGDFQKLFMAASDPLMWLQHPNKNRYKKSEFLNFFEGALQSKGAFVIYDKKTGDVIGSTRYYDYDEKNKSVLIGYTFFVLHCWGKGFNSEVKKMMLDHAFKYVDKVYFHVGAKNKRSQIAIERTGAIKVDEKEVNYHGEAGALNFIYELTASRREEYLREQEESSEN